MIVAKPPSMIDPVCGMEAVADDHEHVSVHNGTTYHFCSNGCRAKFAASPEKYLGQTTADAPVASAQATYTCPMHPQTRKDGPGSCPICGMALQEGPHNRT